MNVKIKIWLVGGCLLFLSWFAYAGTITMTLRGGKLLHVQNLASKTVYIADSSIAGLQIQSLGVIFITGQRVGTTKLFITEKDGTVIRTETLVVTPNVAELLAEIRRVGGAGISASTVGNNVVLRGSVSSPGMGARIREAASRYAGSSGRVIDYMTMSAPAQVYIRVKIVEISRGVSRMIGLKNWSVLFHDSHNNISASNDINNSLFGTIGAGNLLNVATGFNLSAFFEALDEDHLVRILSEPNLTALSGQQATFFAGGEFPILVPQIGGVGINAINTVVYQPFGVSLNFIPTLLEQDIINLQVRTEVSEISNESAIKISGNVVPSLAARRASTVVQLRSGQSFAIAGLVQDNLRDAIERFPLLGRIPVIGVLFNSREFQRDQSELVVIVTPYLVKPVYGRLATPIDGVSEKDVSRYACMINPQTAGCAGVSAGQLRYITE